MADRTCPMCGDEAFDDEALYGMDATTIECAGCGLTLHVEVERAPEYRITLADDPREEGPR